LDSSFDVAKDNNLAPLSLLIQFKSPVSGFGLKISTLLDPCNENFVSSTKLTE
jgi:hypothetical protein